MQKKQSTKNMSVIYEVCQISSRTAFRARCVVPLTRRQLVCHDATSIQYVYTKFRVDPCCFRFLTNLLRRKEIVLCRNPSIMEIDEKIEQRIVIKFLVKSGKTNSETCEMLTAVYGDKTISRSVLYE